MEVALTLPASVSYTHLDVYKRQVVDRAIDGHAADQRRHGDRTHQRRVAWHGIHRGGLRHPRAAAAGVDGVAGGGVQRLLRRPEACRKTETAGTTCGARLIVVTPILRLDPAQSIARQAVTRLKPQADRQIGVIILALSLIHI